MEQLPIRIKGYLERFANNALTERDVSEFVRLSATLVESYLALRRDSIGRLCTDQGTSISDLTHDCVAEVFTQAGDHTYPELQSFLRSLREPITTISTLDLFRAYRSYLIRISSIHRARLYAQSDPSGAAILRNIRDCLRSFPAFARIDRLRGAEIMPTDVEPLLENPPYPPGELEQSFFSLVGNATTTRDLLAVFHRIVTEQDTYRRSIPIATIVQILKRWYSRDGFEIPEDGAYEITAGLTLDEINGIRRRVEEILKSKIISTYLLSRKVTRGEAEIMFKILSDILDDWLEGDAGEPIVSYLRKYQTLDEAAYDRDWRPKLQYLVKVAKEEFRIQLETLR